VGTGTGTHVTERQRDIRAARVIVFWVDIFGLGLWSEACEGGANAISLGRVRKLSEEVGKEYHRRDKKERGREALI
jgi:hypothetical protein